MDHPSALQHIAKAWLGLPWLDVDTGEELEAEDSGNQRCVSYKALGIALDPKNGTTGHKSEIPDWTFIRKV